MENESSTALRGTRDLTLPAEYAKGRKISLNPSAFGSAQMSGKQELPPFATLRDKCDRVGHLKKLCGRGLLSAGTWKDRTCVLYQNQLYLYEHQDSPEPELKGNSTGVVLDLGSLDSVREAPTRVTRKAANVFLLGSTEKGFFDTSANRHYFAAKTLSEMKDWVSVLSCCMESERRRKESGTCRQLPTPATPPSIGSRVNHYIHKDLNTEEFKMASAAVLTTLPRESMLEPLNCAVSKTRAKGPPGRRLPRSKKSMDALLDETRAESPSQVVFRDNRGRATSLSALEYSQSPVDLRPEPRLSQTGQGLAVQCEPTLTNSNPNMSFDFERAWFLKLPGENTSDYSSLHEDLGGDGSSDHRSSLSSSPMPPPPEEVTTKRSRNQSASNRNSRPVSTANRPFCCLL